MAEGDKRRTPSREVPSTGKMYKTLLEPQGTVIRAQIAPCLYCKGSHGFAECSKFAKLPQEMKLETIRKAGLCFACLDKGHFSRNCSSKLICSICAEKKREKYHPKILHQMSPDEIIEQALASKKTKCNF